MTARLQPEDVKEGFIKFYVPLQIRFSDIDGYQHVNNGVYFNYMDMAVPCIFTKSVNGTLGK